MLGPINRKISLAQGGKDQYLQAAQRDIETRRAVHNAELKQYDKEIKPLKREAFLASMKQRFETVGKSVGKMGPM